MKTYQIHKPCPICLGMQHRTILFISDNTGLATSTFYYPWWCDECGIMSEAVGKWYGEED